MTRRDRRALGRYVRRIADRVGLRDWEFEVVCTRDLEDELARVFPTFGRRLAVVEFCACCTRDQDREELRNTVVHELVHCHLAAVQDQAERDLPTHMTRAGYRAYFDSFRRNIEYGVDALAGALAEGLPLIDWPTPRTTKPRP